MNTSDSTTRPSSLLALICLTVVCRYKPEWVAVSISAAARSERLNPERISRLATKALAALEQVVAALTRMGRPPVDRVAEQVTQQLALLKALLEVATSILSEVRRHKPAVQALTVGAFRRLKKQFSKLTEKVFCAALALSPRTFRYWMKRWPASASKPAAVAPQPPPRTPRKRPPRRPRFGFDVMLPDTQLAGDTTDLKTFDVPLKLMAAQDVGGRDQNLLDSIIVEDHECAELVVRVLTEAIDGRPGMQVITDQGTPYMAEATQQALDELEAEHAPQKEGDPLGKATVERAFETVKTLARPILKITNRIAQALPALRCADLAKATTKLVLTALLKAYQAGARAAHRAANERSTVDAEKLAALAEQSRQKARADERSRRLLLTHLHRAHDIKQPLNKFIHMMRPFSLPVLQQAEQALATQAHRSDIGNWGRYFRGIARNVKKTYEQQQARQRASQELFGRIEQEKRQRETQCAAFNTDPASWLMVALRLIAAQWIPDAGQLLAGGAGLGTKYLKAAMARLTELLGPASAVDTASGVFTHFERDHIDKLGPPGVTAVRAVLQRHLPLTPTPPDTHGCTQQFGSVILQETGPPTAPGPPKPC